MLITLLSLQFPLDIKANASHFDSEISDFVGFVTLQKWIHHFTIFTFDIFSKCEVTEKCRTGFWFPSGIWKAALSAPAARSWSFLDKIFSVECILINSCSWMTDSHGLSDTWNVMVRCSTCSASVTDRERECCTNLWVVVVFWCVLHFC